MGAFNFRALDTGGKIVKGVIEADSERLVFAYDAYGNIALQADIGPTVWSLGQYQYDNANRLTTDNVVGTANFSYQYDAGSNRTFLQLGPYGVTQTYAANSNRLTSAWGSSVASDAAGNLSANLSSALTYNNANRLSQSTANSVATNYQYTGLGQRNFKTGAQTIHYDYLPDGKTLSQMQLNANNSYNQATDYIWLDDTPIAQIKTTYTTNNTPSTRRLTYIHADHLNTPRLMTDANKVVVWRWSGDAYGGLVQPNTNPDGDSVSDTLDLRFPGQVADSETGLNYNMNRYYDPLTGRYTQSDPIGLRGGLNTYAYVNDNPVNFYDPDGLSPKGSNGAAQSQNQPLSSWPLNGNLWPGFQKQDNVCSTGPAADSMNSNCKVKQCCIQHDACYTKYHCNASSFLGGLPGACRMICNAEAEACVANAYLSTATSGNGCGDKCSK